MTDGRSRVCLWIAADGLCAGPDTVRDFPVNESPCDTPYRTGSLLADHCEGALSDRRRRALHTRKLTASSMAANMTNTMTTSGMAQFS